MCFSKSKWQKFTPSNKYLEAIKDITSINKLYIFIQSFKRKEDKKDYWQTPEQTLKLKTFDCEDMSIFCQDVLIRQGIEAVVIIYNGTEKGECHAVCVFPGNKFSFISNKILYKNYDNYIDIGHRYYSKLKQMLIYNHEGKIIGKKTKLFGTF